MDEMGDRLRKARLGAGFGSARGAATKFGWKPSTYAAHENGQNKFGEVEARRYAKAFKVSAGWLATGEGVPPAMATTGDIRLAPETRPSLAPVAGIVQGGQFREVDDFGDFKHDPISVDPDPDFPDARQIVFIAEGDSMDAAEPPIKPGSRVVCVDFEDTGLPLRDGMQVVIQRDRDGGSLREWSVKEVRITAEEVECIPRSSNARHKPFRFPLNPSPDDDVTVIVLALVREVINRVPLPR